MEKQSKQAESEINNLKQENTILTTQINGMPTLEFINPSVNLDGAPLDENDPILLVDGKPYYKENVLKLILGHCDKNYEYNEVEVNIGKKVETEKLPLSQAEIYELGYGDVSLDSGVRTDKYGNEFSGILIERDWRNGGYVTYFTNGKYNKMSGILHATKETENDNYATIKIISMNKNKDEISNYTSDEITNLSDPIPFDINIKGATLVQIQQDAYWTNRPIEAVISEAYFYNE